MFNVHLNNTLVTHKIIKATINNNTSVKSTIITFFDYMISSFIIFFFLIITLISLSLMEGTPCFLVDLLKCTWVAVATELEQVESNISTLMIIISLGRVDLGSGLKKLRPSGNCEL